MGDDDQTELEGLHHMKAAGVVRAAETVQALAELEFEEREGKMRQSVLAAVGERAAELVADLDADVAAQLLATVVEGVGESAELVTAALKRVGGGPAEEPKPDTPPAIEEPKPERASSSPTAKPVTAKKPKPGRPLIGPQVRVRAGERVELVPSTQLWSGADRKDRRR